MLKQPNMFDPNCIGIKYLNDAWTCGLKAAQIKDELEALGYEYDKNFVNAYFIAHNFQMESFFRADKMRFAQEMSL